MGADGTIEVPAAVWDAADDLFRAALRLGGTLTGEHGVGVLKRRWLVDELGEDQWELQRQITRVFDPLGILNPGKVFAGLTGTRRRAALGAWSPVYSPCQAGLLSYV